MGRGSGRPPPSGLADRLGRGGLGPGRPARHVEPLRERPVSAMAHPWHELGRRRIALEATLATAAHTRRRARRGGRGGRGQPARRGRNRHPDGRPGIWATMALGLNLRDDRDASRLREYESRVPSFALLRAWAAMLGLFLGAVVPFWRSEAAIAEARGCDPSSPPDFEAAERASTSEPCGLDYYNVRPWLGYANLQQLAWESRGSKPAATCAGRCPRPPEEALSACRATPVPGPCTSSAPTASGRCSSGSEASCHRRTP